MPAAVPTAKSSVIHVTEAQSIIAAWLEAENLGTLGNVHVRDGSETTNWCIKMTISGGRFSNTMVAAQLSASASLPVYNVSLLSRHRGASGTLDGALEILRETIMPRQSDELTMPVVAWGQPVGPTGHIGNISRAILPLEYL